MSRRRSARAFTLIELLVVIVILGILMAVAVPTFLRQQTKAQDSRTQQYLTTAFKAIRAGLPDSGNQYPTSTSMVSWVTQSEPELSAQRGSCTTQVQSAAQDQVLVDPSSTPTALTLCARSKSGNVWKLTASNTGVQQLLDGTLVPLTVSGNEISDATRTAGTSGDGRSSDSSTGVWSPTTNLAPAAVDSSLHGYNGADTGAGAPVDSGFYRFTKNSPSLSQIYSQLSTLSITSGTVYTWSAVIRTDGTGWDFRPGTWDASFGNVNPPATKVDLGNGTYRLSGSWTATTTMSGVRSFDLWENSWGTSTYVDVKWAQVEAKAYATPYVSGGQTRTSARVQAPAALISSTQSWIAMRVRVDRPLSNALGNVWPRLFAWGYNHETTPRNSIDIYYNGPNGSWGIVSYNNDLSSGKTGTTNQYTYSGDGSEYVTVIGSWTASQLGISVNGSAFGTTARNGVPALSFDSLFDIGNLSGNQQFDGDILWFACGTGVLADADAATINSFGNADPKVSAFPAAAQTTMVWNGASTSGSLK